MVCKKTNIKAVFCGALALATGADCLRTSFTVSELARIAAGEASLQEEYSRVQRAAAADIDPSLLYPAHNLSVPIDHFHNDSLYEPHVSLKAPTPTQPPSKPLTWVTIDERHFQLEILVRREPL